MTILNKRQVFKQDPCVYIKDSVRKEYYDLVYKDLERLKVNSVLDVGCATGDFLYYLDDQKIQTQIGIDISNELIKLARKRVAHAKFHETDVFEFCQQKTSFDAVCLLGTLHTFLDYEELIGQICYSCSPRVLIIQSPFNTNPVDVRVFHADAIVNSEKMQYQCAYSIYCLEKFTSFLKTLGAVVSVKNYEMKQTLKRDYGDPMRNYHINVDGEKCLTNGASIILREFIVTAEFN
jgi:2-polyprenyl-3-methyl-5-hydroxy-6-metoxy-1,4-benzoquinol methylase